MPYPWCSLWTKISRNWDRRENLRSISDARCTVIYQWKYTWSSHTEGSTQSIIFRSTSQKLSLNLLDTRWARYNSSPSSSAAEIVLFLGIHLFSMPQRNHDFRIALIQTFPTIHLPCDLVQFHLNLLETSGNYHRCVASPRTASRVRHHLGLTYHI